MQAGEYGILLTFDTEISLADIEGVVVRIRRPDGSEIEQVADVASEELGTVTYRTVEGDIPGDLPGVYEMQVIVTVGPDQVLHSAAHRFHVAESLAGPTAES
jgi:hypothetical protein